MMTPTLTSFAGPKGAQAPSDIPPAPDQPPGPAGTECRRVICVGWDTEQRCAGTSGPEEDSTLAASTQSTTSSMSGRCRVLRSSSVVGRHPKRCQVAATEVANDGT